MTDAAGRAGVARAPGRVSATKLEVFGLLRRKTGPGLHGCEQEAPVRSAA